MLLSSKSEATTAAKLSDAVQLRITGEAKKPKRRDIDLNILLRIHASVDLGNNTLLITFHRSRDEGQDLRIVRLLRFIRALPCIGDVAPTPFIPH